MYKYEMHLHTSGCSKCGQSTAIEMIDAARKNGYAGVVFTNHFYHGNTAIDRDLPWNDFMQFYADDYYSAKEYAKGFDIDVLFGIEEWFNHGKEFLIYGLDPNHFINQSSIINMSIPEITDFVHKNGGFISVAHPFRNRPYIKDPHTPPNMQYFDAIEVYNRFNTPEDNNIARQFAKDNNLLVTAGGDIHRAEDFGKSGLAFYEKLGTNKSLVKALKEQKFRLIIDGEIV